MRQQFQKFCLCGLLRGKVEAGKPCVHLEKLIEDHSTKPIHKTPLFHHLPIADVRLFRSTQLETEAGPAVGRGLLGPHQVWYKQWKICRVV